MNADKTPLEAAAEGTREVAMPILVSVIAFCIVFFPIMFLLGILAFSPRPSCRSSSCRASTHCSNGLRDWRKPRETAAAEANVAVAKSEADLAETMARYLVIRAPDDGAILRQYVDPGALIRAGQNDGTALLKFARIDCVRVVVDVPMADTRTARSSAVTSELSGGEQVILAGGSQITAGQPVDAVLAQK